MENSPSKKPLRKLVEQETGYNVLISTSAWHSLAKRAGKNDIPLSVVEQVYARGYLTADETSKNSPEQQAFSRVDSFLHGGQAQNLDEDLLEIVVPKGHRHIHIVKSAIKRYESRDNPLKEEGVYPAGYKTVRGLYKIYKNARKIQAKSREDSESSSSEPKRRKYKYEKEAEKKRTYARADQRSREREASKREKVSKETGISKKKLQYGHGSGPLSPDELKRIKKAENKSSSSSSTEYVDRYKAPTNKLKHKIAAWAANKLADTRNKYEKKDD